MNEIQKRDEVFDLKELFLKAIEKDASIDTLERLMKIREDIKKENAKEQFNNSLKELQAELRPIPPDCVVKNKDGSVRYRYPSLKQILTYIQPLLTKYGFSISFETEKTEKNEIKVICYLKHISGHQEQSSFVIPLDTSSYMSDIQKMGSTLTYAKRYALTSMLNITTDEDTDGIETEIRVTEPEGKEKEPVKKDKPTVKEMKYYYIYLGKLGVSKEEAKALLKKIFNTDTLKDLNRKDFDELMDTVKAMKTKEDFDSFLGIKNEK